MAPWPPRAASRKLQLPWPQPETRQDDADDGVDFAQAVIDAGLTWIGPPPQAIRDLGDKVSARHIAQRAGAPQVPGTSDPVAGSDDVVAFAQEFGLPVAIKAAFGGGGRGLKVARTVKEIPKLYDSAVREAVAAFGRGECFVERYLDRPRHVETQVLADQHGNAVVVSTRDCSLQRRHQKLVEEAPAPFLTPQQEESLYKASKAIVKEAGYYGAGTCEFLVGEDGGGELGAHVPRRDGVARDAVVAVFRAVRPVSYTHHRAHETPEHLVFPHKH